MLGRALFVGSLVNTKQKKIECLRNLVSVLSWHSLTYHFVIYFDFHFVLLAKREREGERERDIDR